MKENKQEESYITFKAKEKEVIRLEKGKFFFKGQEVKDKHKVYERFNDWLKEVEKPKINK